MAEAGYERGAIDGRVEARLDNQESRLDHVDDLLEKVGQDINGLVLATRHLEEAARADKETATATAKALADAEKARRDKTEERWTPLQRSLAVIAGTVGVASTATGWVYLLVR
jgi:hypothetical protein